MKIIDRSIGVYHFLFDRVPSKIPEVPPKPRKQNVWLKDGKPVVVKFHTENDIRQSLNQVINLLGPLTASIASGDKVLVKPNYNSADPSPASTDPTFLRAMLEILLESGAKVTVGESSGGVWRPTRNVFKQVQLYELTRSLGVGIIDFDEDYKDWIRINTSGDYLHSVVMPRAAYEADKLIYLPCLKTHRLSRYSGALKLAFGFVHPGDRRDFHLRYREEKLAEISLCWQPDLIVMDGRKAFVTGGPNRGEIVEPKIILASGDLIAADVEAVKILLSYKARNHLLEDPWKLPQILTALKHQLGAYKDNYTLVTR
jgi:uncharacterized protein (DUF362 family)